MHFTELGEKEKELLKKCIGLTDRIRNLSTDDLKEIKIIQRVLAMDLFENEELEEVLGEINMEFDLEMLAVATQALAEKKIAAYNARKEGKIEGKIEGKVEGREEGREEMQYEIASELLDEGVPVDRISKCTHLDMNIINSLIVLKNKK